MCVSHGQDHMCAGHGVRAEQECATYRRREDSIRPRPAGNMKTLQQLTGPGEVRTEVHVWLTRNPNNEQWLCIDHASVCFSLSGSSWEPRTVWQ